MRAVEHRADGLGVAVARADNGELGGEALLAGEIEHRVDDVHPERGGDIVERPAP